MRRRAASHSPTLRLAVGVFAALGLKTWTVGFATDVTYMHANADPEPPLEASDASGSRSHTDEMHIIYERSRAQLVSSLVNTVVLLESRMRVLSVHRVWFRNRVRFVILPTDPDGTARDCGPKAGTGDAAAISEDMQQPKAWQGILDAAAARGAGRDVLARPCVVAARVRRSRSEQRGGG